jgi:hypothetical protein
VPINDALVTSSGLEISHIQSESWAGCQTPPPLETVGVVVVAGTVGVVVVAGTVGVVVVAGTVGVVAGTVVVVAGTVVVVALGVVVVMLGAGFRFVVVAQFRP